MISWVYITLPYDKARTFLIESLLLIILKRLNTVLSYSNIANIKHAQSQMHAHPQIPLVARKPLYPIMLFYYTIFKQGSIRL